MIKSIQGEAREEREPFIIYVDDDEDDLLMIEQTLRSLEPDLSFRAFTSGIAAFTFLESLPVGAQLPSLIILDLNMPGWSGIQTLMTIKAQPEYQHLPVGMFTNSDNPEHKKECLLYGAADYFNKPYNPAQMKATCMAFLDYRRQARQFK